MSIQVDIGGEGRHVGAWNVNPSRTKTIGPDRGQPIPRHIVARAEKLPFPDASIGMIVVEKTPLRRAALREIARVIAPHGVIILRHVPLPKGDRHAPAKKLLPGRLTRDSIQLGGQRVQESRFEL